MGEKKNFIVKSIDLIKGGFNYNFESKVNGPEFKDIVKKDDFDFLREKINNFFADKYISKEEYDKLVGELDGIKYELATMNKLLEDGENSKGLEEEKILAELKEEIKNIQNFYANDSRHHMKDSREFLEKKANDLDESIAENVKSIEDDMKAYIEENIVARTKDMKSSIDAMFWVVFINSLLLLACLYYIYTIG